MLGDFGRSVGSLLGVEITADSIRMVHLRRHRRALRVAGWAVEPYLGAQSTGSEHLHAALREAHARCATRQRQVALALPASQVICKVCQVLADPSAEAMEAQLLGLADQLFPFPLDDLALDFQLLGPSAQAPGKVDALVVACRQSQLDPFEQLFAQVGLELVAVEVDSLALWRALTPGDSLVLQMENAQLVTHRWPDGDVPQRQQTVMASPEQWGEHIDGLAGAREVLLIGAGASPGRARSLSERLGVACRLACPPALAGLEDIGPSMVLAYGLAQGGVA